MGRIGEKVESLISELEKSNQTIKCVNCDVEYNESDSTILINSEGEVYEVCPSCLTDENI